MLKNVPYLLNSSQKFPKLNSKTLKLSKILSKLNSKIPKLRRKLPKLKITKFVPVLIGVTE